MLRVGRHLQPCMQPELAAASCASARFGNIAAKASAPTSSPRAISAASSRSPAPPTVAGAASRRSCSTGRTGGPKPRPSQTRKPPFQAMAPLRPGDGATCAPSDKAVRFMPPMIRRQGVWPGAPPAAIVRNQQRSTRLDRPLVPSDSCRCFLGQSNTNRCRLTNAHLGYASWLDVRVRHRRFKSMMQKALGAHACLRHRPGRSGHG